MTSSLLLKPWPCQKFVSFPIKSLNMMISHSVLSCFVNVYQMLFHVLQGRWWFMMILVTYVTSSSPWDAVKAVPNLWWSSTQTWEDLPWPIPLVDGLEWKIPSRNGWWMDDEWGYPPGNINSYKLQVDVEKLYLDSVVLSWRTDRWCRDCPIQKDDRCTWIIRDEPWE